MDFNDNQFKLTDTSKNKNTVLENNTIFSYQKPKKNFNPFPISPKEINEIIQIYKTITKIIIKHLKNKGHVYNQVIKAFNNAI